MQPSMPLTAVDHPALSFLPAAPTRDQLERFGHLVQSLEGEHGIVDISTSHVQADKMYGRGVVIRAGTYLVGLPHLAGHINVCVGDITVWTEGRSHRLTGAHILPSAPGTFRVGFAHVDTTWFTVHRNDTGTTEIETIEASLVEHPERLLTRRHLEIAA